MHAMVLNRSGSPLVMERRPIPQPNEDQLLIRVSTCGICRTDLHIFDGELKNPKLPLILGHQIVGTVIETGSSVDRFKVGDRVGLPWLAKSCGVCHFCQTGRENLCDSPLFTGYTIDGGFAEFTLAYADFALRLPSNYSDLHLAPLLCGGLIGYRAWRMLTDAKRIGFFGFGSSAHILAQIATFQNREIYAFTRKGDLAGQEFAKKCGAVWAGASDELPPLPLDGAIIFAPVGALMPQALRAVQKGGSVISAGIHMSDIPSFPYSLLWEERSLRSVANLTRQDGIEFLKIASQVEIQTEVTSYSLSQANEALHDLRRGRFKGSAVIKI
jgi:alcohol dehydrogenase, propanol-preferring